MKLIGSQVRLSIQRVDLEGKTKRFLYKYDESLDIGQRIKLSDGHLSMNILVVFKSFGIRLFLIVISIQLLFTQKVLTLIFILIKLQD